MPYNINYTDPRNKSPIFVEDLDINAVDTSLQFPGNYVTGYAQIIAENFLHILENFANTTEPPNPVEGQLWYDTTSDVDQLKIYNGTVWVSASGLKKSTSVPPLSSSSTGDLWVNTKTQQLYLFTGSTWTLIGPEFSSGEFTGIKSEILIGTDNNSYTVFSIKVNDVPLAIVSQVTFTPKLSIAGFTKLSAGITLSSLYSLKYNGTAEKAENLVVGAAVVPASNFLRSDQPSTTDYKINIRNNIGLAIGNNAQLSINVEGDSGVIQNVVAGASMDVRMRNGSVNVTAIKIKSNGNIGFGDLDPTDKISVIGNMRVAPLTVNDNTSGMLFVDSTTDTDNISSGSIITKGGIGIAKGLQVGGSINLKGSLITYDISPNINALSNIGTSANRYKEIHAVTVIGNVQGNVIGRLTGSADSATKLTNPTTFVITGDVEAPTILFDGQSGGQTKTFQVSIKNSFISNRTSTDNATDNDEILLNKTFDNAGVYKISKKDFIKSIPTTPIGSLMQYAGRESPTGWLLCDGSIVKKADYSELYKIVGHSFKPAAALADQGANTFALPDFRGRVALGLDNMGGTAANRVSGYYNAATLGNVGGDKDVTILTKNLPDHKHDLKGNAGSQFYAVRTNSETSLDTDSIPLQVESGVGGTQGIPSSGALDSELKSQPMHVMNPYLAINYIIYTGV